MIDQAQIILTAGHGGRGAATFRREKYIPFGGPDGGDGGDGGNIILKVNPQLSTLSEFNRVKHFEAENGKPGMGQRKHGKDGKDLTLFVPLGTEIYRINDDIEKKIADLLKPEDSLVIAYGGEGGLGNCHFATSTHQAPREFTPGEPGEVKNIRLNLKLIADVGIIGLPNIGKSTFISLVTKAKPKIADYAFTTLEPTLGKVDHKGASFVMADIPGLIEGASEGKGLGDKFLQHVDRTRLLVHFVSGDSLDPEADYNIVRQELTKYDTKLAKRPEIVVLSRSDLVNKDNQEKITKFVKSHKALELTFNDRNTALKVLDQVILYLDK